MIRFAVVYIAKAENVSDIMRLYDITRVHPILGTAALRAAGFGRKL